MALWGLFSSFGGSGTRSNGDKPILEFNETDKSDVDTTVKESSKGIRVLVGQGLDFPLRDFALVFMNGNEYITDASASRSSKG